MPRAWKDKTLDYEIETRKGFTVSVLLPCTWKDKTLDYEIETPIFNLFKIRPRFPWKDKTLDYEIETQNSVARADFGYALEKIRLSITRLKQ